MKEADIPLCVDLDGTLLLTDTLFESLLRCVKQNPLTLFLIAAWLPRGRAYLKWRLAERVALNVSTLPWHREFCEFLKQQRGAGRTLILATGAGESVARAVVEHTGIFDGYAASDQRTNLTGANKAALLTGRYGRGGFDYAGNGRADLKVWAAARRAVLVNVSGRLAKRAAARCAVEKTFLRGGKWRAWLSALRVHQWVKNLLLFVPLFCAHEWRDGARLGLVALGFVAFSLCASSVYITNDLLDLDADRAHAGKKARGFASGNLSLSAGLAAGLAALSAAAALGVFLPAGFVWIWSGYFIVSTSYSLWLKKAVILDVIVLALLYGARIFAGGVIAGVVISHWLMAFSLFFFVSLAFVKRFVELQKHADALPKGRGYGVADARLIGGMGVCSGYLSVLVLALYVTNPDVTGMYHRPEVLWLWCPVLIYWISRVWLLAQRNQLHDDPVVFTVKDKASWLVGLATALIALLAGPR